MVKDEYDLGPQFGGFLFDISIGRFSTSLYVGGIYIYICFGMLVLFFQCQMRFKCYWICW